MSASLIDVDDLIEFIDELRLAGYDISTQQYIGAQNLLLGLAANGHLPPDPRALHTWLAPVLCSSPREQENFYRRFDRWVTRNPRLTERETSKEKLDEKQKAQLEEEHGRDWFSSRLQMKWLLVLAAVLLIIGGIIFALPRVPRTLTGRIVDSENKQPLADASVSFVGKTSVSDSNGGFATTYRLKDLPNTLTVDYPEYEAATVTVTTENRSKLVIPLQKPGPTAVETPPRIATPTEPSPTQLVTPSIVPVPTAVPVVTPAKPVVRNYLRWVRLGGIIFPFFLLGMWWLWKRKLSRALLEKLQSANQPRLDQIVVKGAAGQLFLGQSFRRTIQELRRHRQRGASELDASRTVHRTIQRGGLFSPLYGARQTLPEYLVLIDRASFQDQQARLEDEIIRRLVADNVFVDSYYFQGDPRVCRKQEKDTHFVTLQEMAALHPDHHLIIFGDGSSFINPVTGEPERWLEMFAPWTKRAIMTPESPAHWGYREWALAELDFIMLPATKEGLAALTEVIDSGTTPRMDRDQRARPFPAMLRERPRRWLENTEPQPDLTDRLCDQLKLFLGSKGYFWLSACAVYPILHWDLTLYLGFKLFRDRSELEDRLLPLVRLPWFRYGTLPDWLRLKLISELPPDDEKTIRGVLEELFRTVLQQPAEGIRLDIASKEERSGRGLRGLLERLKKRLTNWKFKRFLWQFLRNEPPESPLRDYVFLAFMSGRKPRKLTVGVPDAIRRLFFPRGQLALGLRPVSALVLATICSLAVFFVTWRSTQATSTDQSEGVDSSKVTPTPAASPSAVIAFQKSSPGASTTTVVNGSPLPIQPNDTAGNIPIVPNGARLIVNLKWATLGTNRAEFSLRYWERKGLTYKLLTTSRSAIGSGNTFVSFDSLPAGEFQLVFWKSGSGSSEAIVRNFQLASQQVLQITQVLPSPTGLETPKPTPTPTPIDSSITLTANPVQTEEGQPVAFVARLTSRGSYKYRFAFGDGSITDWQTSSQTVHKYLRAGSYRAGVELGIGTDRVTNTLAYAFVMVVVNPSGSGAIPNLIGKPESEVRAMFNPKMEFSLGTVTYTSSSSVTAGTVISQQPAAGTAAPNGTRINIVVAKESASSDEGLIVVPNVVGMDHAKAEVLLRVVGLAALQEVRKGNDRVKNVVKSQSPAAGTKVQRGTPVTIRWVGGN